MHELPNVRINSSFSQILVDWMDLYGHDDQELRTQINFVKSSDWLDIDQWQHLLTQTAQITSNPDVGIEIGASVMVQHAGILGYLMLNSKTLADALETYLLCEKHFYNVNFGELTQTTDYWELSWPNVLGDNSSLFNQVSLSALITFLRQRFHGSCEIAEISFVCSTPEDKSIYEHFFNCQVNFNQTYTGIIFNAKSIHRKANGILPDEYQAIRNHQIKAFNQVIKINDPFLQRLQHLILTLLPENKAGLSCIASQLNCSTRTLQRKLQIYNLSFQQLLDGVREQLALRYLKGTSLSYIEIALLLGYSDQSSFTRAIKGWTNNTPKKIRLEIEC